MYRQINAYIESLCTKQVGRQIKTKNFPYTYSLLFIASGFDKVQFQIIFKPVLYVVQVHILGNNFYGPFILFTIHYRYVYNYILPTLPIAQLGAQGEWTHQCVTWNQGQENLSRK